MSRVKVYVAGPYSGGDKEANVQAALRAASELLDAGFCPFVPHLSHFWHLRFPRHYEQWMAYDLEWVPCCDVLLRLPGESPGADREEAWAREHGMPVFYSVGALVVTCSAVER